MFALDTPSNPHQKWEISLETGSVFQSQNQVRVPNSGGSTVNLSRLIGRGPHGYFRVNGIFRNSENDGFRWVIAPLSISGVGSVSSPISFDNQQFAAGTPLRAEYQFNSYRFTYWRRARAAAGDEWRFGYTLKVRDARVTLQQGATRASFYNLGVVPLLHFSGAKRLGDRTKLLVDFDGLLASQGRALDLGLQVAHRVSESADLFAGYRVLEGGADVPATYNSALLQYLSVGFRVRF